MELSNLIGSIRNISLNDRLSDDAVVALMNIHLSMMSMIFTGMSDAGYGSAEYHRDAVGKLFSLCRKRSTANQSLLRCSRLTPVMYTALCLPDTVFDNRRHDACLSRSFRMADKWRKQTDDMPLPSDRKSRMTEYGILQSLIGAFAYVVEEDKVSDPDFLYLKRRISEWASEMNEDGSWSGICDYEAIRRIDIMIGNSNSDSDTRFDMQIERGLNCCFNKITAARHIDCQTLFYLYRAMMFGIGISDIRKVDMLAEYAVRQLDSYPHGSDEWLWYASVAVDRECEKINNNIKRQMLA